MNKILNTGDWMTFAGALQVVGAYILKVDFLDVRNPQKIQIFRRKIVSERENYQFCNVLEKILLIDTLSLCSIELNKHSY